MYTTQKCWIFVPFGTEQFGSRGYAAIAGGNDPSQTGLPCTKRGLVSLWGYLLKGYWILISYILAHLGTILVLLWWHIVACWYVAILVTCHGHAQSSTLTHTHTQNTKTQTQTSVFHTFECTGRGFSPVAVRPSSCSIAMASLVAGLFLNPSERVGRGGAPPGVMRVRSFPGIAITWRDVSQRTDQDDLKLLIFNLYFVPSWIPNPIWAIENTRVWFCLY